MKVKEQYMIFARDIRESTLSYDRALVSFLPDLEKILRDCCAWNIDTSDLQDKEEARKYMDRIFQKIKKDFWKKEYLLRITNYFFDYFVTEWQGTINRDRFLTADKFYDDAELDIKLLKYLQSGEDENTKKTRQGIANHFSISDTALKEHLNKLKYGCDLLGEHVQIDLRRGKNTYDSTVHPLFLALDLSDMYFLSIVLPRLSKGTAYSQTANTIAKRVYEQLSEYASGIIEPIAAAEGCDYSQADGSWQGDLAFYEKSGKTCSILYADFEKPLVGHFEMSAEENFVLESGERMAIDYRKIMEVRKKL